MKKLFAMMISAFFIVKIIGCDTSNTTSDNVIANVESVLPKAGLMFI